MVDGFIGIDKLRIDFNSKCLQMFSKTDCNKPTITSFIANQATEQTSKEELFPVILIAECIYLECIVLQEFHQNDTKYDRNENMIICMFCSNIINYILKENFNTEAKEKIAKSINDETTKTSIRNVKLHVGKEKEDYCYKKHFKNNLENYIKIIKTHKNI
eukprot:GAHX01002817.1.p1 GENE.GAHX01002817.1~~GAHX01002817.1.p1  ORF type:complete len:160 (-),score=36.57 GAHX01002817.1:161-640(-)